MRILDTTTNWNRTFKNEDEIDDEQSARELFLFRPPAVRTWNCSDSRPVKDTFISASRARCRPRGEGWGVEEGGRLLEWIKLRHRTRVIVLKLSFNGRQCQKLSCLFRQEIVSIPFCFRVSIVRACRCYFVGRYDFSRIRLIDSARFKTWIVWGNMAS